MKRFREELEELKDRICRWDTEDYQRRAVEYYAHAILSIEESRDLLVSYVPEVPSDLIAELKKVLSEQMPLHGYWESQGIVCDREKVIALALVDILLALMSDSVSRKEKG